MPQYYKDVWKDLEIEATPVGFKRKFRFLRYYVGQIVKFRLSIKRLSKQSPKLTKYQVYERLPGRNTPKRLQGLGLTDDSMELDPSIIEGSLLNRQGDVEYILGDYTPKDGLTLVTANVASPDKRNSQIGYALLGAFLTLIVGILLINIPNVQFPFLETTISTEETQEPTVEPTDNLTSTNLYDYSTPCYPDSFNPPCTHLLDTESEGNYYDIAWNLTGNQKRSLELAPRIRDLIRNDYGSIGKLPLEVLVPSPNAERNLTYLKKYLEYDECLFSSDSNNFPCLFEVTEAGLEDGYAVTYRNIAVAFYSGNMKAELCIKEANQIFSPEPSIYYEIEDIVSGLILVLPDINDPEHPYCKE